MSRVMRDQCRRVTGGHSIKISGKNVNIYFARIAYKCESCFGDLEIHGAGLRCKTKCGGHRFITNVQIEEIKEQKREQMAEVEANYEIIDGQIVYKETK